LVALAIFAWASMEYLATQDDSLKGELNLIAWVASCWSLTTIAAAFSLTYVFREKTKKIHKACLAFPLALASAALMLTIIFSGLSK